MLRGRLTVLYFLPLAAMLVLMVVNRAEAAVSCQRTDGGRYSWGESPAGCDAQPLGDVARAQSVYGGFIFDRRKAKSSAHVRSYMNNMNALIRDLAAGYIKRRNPRAGQAEVDAFVRAIHSVATQESYWTHFRWGTDGRLKIMIGDQGKSYGIMQLHDGAHASRGREKRFDLTSNLMLGIEQFYQGWAGAKNTRCGRGGVTAFARSAYSAYNGGPRAICRWTNKSAEWARNDTGYWEKYSGRPWLRLVNDASKKLTVDIECLKAGRSTCAGRAPEKPAAEPAATGSIAGQIVSLEDGRQCFSATGKELHCATDVRVLSCLEAYKPELLQARVIRLKKTDAVLNGVEIKAYGGRDELCLAAVKDLALPGEFVKLSADLALLDKADGASIGTARAGETYQVVDYEVSPTGANLRYRVAGRDGKFPWIAAGEPGARKVVATTYAPSVKSAVKALPVAGDEIMLVRPGGVNMRAAAATTAEILATIPEKTALTVKFARAIGGMGERWLLVEFGGKTGYVYSGHSAPEVDTARWVAIGGVQ